MMWLTWWQGDMLGAVVIAPVILLSFRRQSILLTLANAWEFLVLIISSTAICLVNFQVLKIAWFTDYPKLYLILPFLVWAAIRFELIGAALFNLLIAILR